MVPNLVFDDPLRLYTKADVGVRAHLSERRLEDLASRPDCPLKFVQPRHGKAKVCNAQVLQAFLAWLLTEPDIRVDGAKEAG